ncbi:MAG: hypothetical protein GXP26_17450 [Planctomycetes bacterium]|nr:hypothetical protein [Planctomycetota bacterium]
MGHSLLWTWGFLALLISLFLCNGTSVVAEEKALPLLLQEDFEQGFGRWQTTDVDKPFWEIKQQNGSGGTNQVLRVLGPSTYQPPHRSPPSIALLKDVLVSDFVLRLKLQSTNTTAGPHRDLCLFWGYQDPAHFYYVHLGEKTDSASCQIFIVNESPRTPITVDKATGTPWTNSWHEAKIIRSVSTGQIEVYFDNMKKPLMTASDTTFSWGQIGIGTFDDHGNFDDIELWAVRRSAGEDLPD